MRNGNTQSCGCLQTETRSANGQKNHKTNVYDLSGDFGIGWTSNTNQGFYFDLEDYDNTEQEAIRNKWVIDTEIPIFTQDKDYVNKLIFI